MVDILSIVSSFSIGSVIALLINAIVASIILIIVNKAIAKNFQVKHAFTLSLIALFIVPLIGTVVSSYVDLPAIIFAYILPLIVWIALGQLLLKEQWKAKLTVIVAAFIIYTFLGFLLVPYISQAFSLVPV